MNTFSIWSKIKILDKASEFEMEVTANKSASSLWEREAQLNDMKEQSINGKEYYLVNHFASIQRTYPAKGVSQPPAVLKDEETVSGTYPLPSKFVAIVLIVAIYRAENFCWVVWNEHEFRFYAIPRNWMKKTKWHVYLRLCVSVSSRFPA